MCNNGITQFYLPPTHGPYLPLLRSRKVSPHFGWYSLHLPTKGWPGWVDLSGWSHTEINVLHRELNLDTVTHPGTNWARCVTSRSIFRWILLTVVHGWSMDQSGFFKDVCIMIFRWGGARWYIGTQIQNGNLFHWRVLLVFFWRIQNYFTVVT